MPFSRRDFFTHLGAIVAAEAIISGALWFFRTQLYSAFSSFFGGDPLVRGEWETFLQRTSEKPDSRPHERAQLRQFGRSVWGTTREIQHSRDYQVDGKLYANTLVLTYHEIGGHAFESGAIVLTILPGASEMEGYEIEQGPNAKPTPSKYKWKRVP